MIWTYLLQGIGLGFAAAIQPGPFQTYVITQTLSRGWRHTLPAALAPLVSDGPIIAIAMLVLSQLPPWFQQILYLAGGLFILYLAFNAGRAWRDFDRRTEATAPPPRQSVFRAALMNALSPGPYIYWSLVTGPILLAGWRESPLNGIGFLASFYTAIVSCLAVIILVFGTAQRFGPRVNRSLLGISAIALAGFGLYQLWLGIAF
ncbi:MAG: LysE family translocator [Anaerolineales bacterium]|nr:LysE family translocator [Anaerolineales bacterium]